MNKPELTRTAKVPFAARYDNFVGGKRVAPKSGRYFDNASPVNGRSLCEIARSDAADIEAALDAVHAAKDAWGRTSAAERARLLNRIADVMEDNLAACHCPRSRRAPASCATSASPSRTLCTAGPRE